MGKGADAVGLTAIRARGRNCPAARKGAFNLPRREESGICHAGARGAGDGTGAIIGLHGINLLS